MTEAAPTNRISMTTKTELNKNNNNKQAERVGERPWGLNPNKELQPTKERREREQ